MVREWWLSAVAAVATGRRPTTLSDQAEPQYLELSWFEW